MTYSAIREARKVSCCNRDTAILNTCRNDLNKCIREKSPLIIQCGSLQRDTQDLRSTIDWMRNATINRTVPIYGWLTSFSTKQNRVHSTIFNLAQISSGLGIWYCFNKSNSFYKDSKVAAERGYLCERDENLNKSIRYQNDAILCMASLASTYIINSIVVSWCNSKKYERSKTEYKICLNKTQKVFNDELRILITNITQDSVKIKIQYPKNGETDSEFALNKNIYCPLKHGFSVSIKEVDISNNCVLLFIDKVGK